MAHTANPASTPDAESSEDPETARSRRPEESTVEAAVETMQLLGEVTRLRLLRALCDGELDVRTLARVVGADRSRVSQHLAKLRRVGLVDRRKDGSRSFYRLRDPSLRMLVLAVLWYAGRHNGVTRCEGEPGPSWPSLGKIQSRRPPTADHDTGRQVDSA